MHPFLLPLVAATALTGAAALPAAAQAAGISPRDGAAISRDAIIQLAHYDADDWHAREWRERQREEWRRRSAWRHWHEAEEWREEHRDRY